LVARRLHDYPYTKALRKGEMLMKIGRKVLFLTMIVISSLTIFSMTHSLGAQDVKAEKAEKEWIPDTASDVPFWIAGNSVDCNRFPSSRKIYLFMNSQDFNILNLEKIYHHLSAKYAHPAHLSVSIHTDKVVLQKWKDLLDEPSPPINRDDVTPVISEGEEVNQLWEETGKGSYQAELNRVSGREWISYSPDIVTGNRISKELFSTPLEFMYTNDVNADLVQAALKGCLECVSKLLDQGANPNWKTKYGLTALLRAVYFRRVEIIKILLDRGANINVNDFDGWTPLLCAVSSPLSESIAIDLVRRGADVNAKTQCGDSVLVLAVRRGGEQTELVEELLNKGADFTVKSQYGRTPLYIAKKQKHYAIAKLLMEKGAKE
jgi:hypothetical protein